jgi:hypothetical protein
VFSYTCGLAIFNFEVVFEKFQTVNELEANEFSSISSRLLEDCRSGNQNWFFTCRVHIFTDRKLKIGVCIENVWWHLLFNFLKDIPTP